MEHASGWRHGGGPAAGLAASRHPRRHRQQLHRCSGGLRQRAAPCLAGVPLQAQMLAAWRRPPRGVPVRPKCLGVIHSGRPFQARDAYDGCSRVRRPSGEPGLRVVARVDLCIAREKDLLFILACLCGYAGQCRASESDSTGLMWSRVCDADL